MKRFFCQNSAKAIVPGLPNKFRRPELHRSRKSFVSGEIKKLAQDIEKNLECRLVKKDEQ